MSICNGRIQTAYLLRSDGMTERVLLVVSAVMKHGVPVITCIRSINVKR